MALYLIGLLIVESARGVRVWIVIQVGLSIYPPVFFGVFVGLDWTGVGWGLRCGFDFPSALLS
jgi:hypothetical protein